MWLVAVLKPFLYVWAGLNAIDAIGFGTRVARLAVSTVLNHRGGGGDDNNNNEMCSVCDDVMADLLVGSDGLSAIPCGAACFRVPHCVQMCLKVKEASTTSIEFPCIAAGFCKKIDQEEQEEIGINGCRGGNFFSCKPRRYCRRVRKGVRFTCELRPGIGRWTGMKNMASKHTAALAQGIYSQKHCGEQGAGPYCIARPKGLGAVAEVAGIVISVLIGGYKSVVAIESPGGSDDRQWLIFWLILAIIFFLEHTFARVILSTLPFYFEAKFLALIWLIWWEGADFCYRRLKRFLLANNCIISSGATAAQEELQRMRSLGGDMIESHRRQSLAELNAFTNAMSLPEKGTKRHWEHDPDMEESLEHRAIKELFDLSAFILSAEGATAIARSTKLSSNSVGILLERAASVVSFQPRFLNVTLLGTIEGPRGKVPSMDDNGLADPYVVCRLIPENGSPYPKRGVTSSICYKTLCPQWNQHLEIPLRGGILDKSGFYESHGAIKSTQLHFDVQDADVGAWSLVYRFFQFYNAVLCSVVVMMWMYDFALSGTQQHWAWLMIGLAGAGYIGSYVMAVIRRSDDEPIGECLVPLDILMDQGEHILLLTLRFPEQTDNTFLRRQNSVGCNGVIRVKLSLSEN